MKVMPIGITFIYLQGMDWLTVSASSGTTPFTFTLNAASGSLAAGTYTALVTVDGPAGGQYINVTLTVTVPGRMTISGVTNGASFTPQIAPDTWVTITGTAMAPELRPWA